MRIFLSLLCVSLLSAGCDDFIYKPSTSTGSPTGTNPGTTDTEPDTTDTGPIADGWCAVLELTAVSCVSCHSPAGGPLGGLDLQTDPYTALMDGTSAYSGRTLVVPGDPDASFLIVKLRGDQEGTEGALMPPLGAIDAEELAAIEAWVADGATEECSGVDTGLEPDAHHPPGFDEQDVHGLAAKLQEETCVECHGADLTGGDVGVSCDSCHPKDWRTDCVFCHGGVDTLEGAPPRDIDGETDVATISFPAHTDHVTTDIHGAYGCAQCHDTPTDVLTPGHLFLGDVTPAVAEVQFGEGLSAAGTYTGGTCSNLYCHGNGQSNNGSVTAATGSDDCDACHAAVWSGEDAWDEMSDEHDKHLEEGIVCGSCHSAVVSGGSTIIDPTLHVDGALSVVPESPVTWNGSGCTGSCHGEQHNNRTWY